MFATAITIDGLKELLEALKGLPHQLTDSINTLLWYDGFRTGATLGGIAVLAAWLFANTIRKGN